MKKYFLIPIFVLILGLSFVDTALAVSGFVPKQIWYSKDKLVEGETVEIYTSVWNGENEPILVKVDFFDFDIILGSREIVVKSNELKDVSIVWKVTAGEHEISAKIVSSEMVVGEEKKNVSLRYTRTESDKQDVEKEKIIVDKKPPVVDSGSGELSLLEEYLPESVASTITESYAGVDGFRNKTAEKITEEKNKAKEEVEFIKIETQPKDSLDKNKKVDNIIEKPFAYIKLFVLTALSFIFENKIIFYGLIVLVIFYIFKSIFRSFKHK